MIGCGLIVYMRVSASLSVRERIGEAWPRGSWRTSSGYRAVGAGTACPEVPGCRECLLIAPDLLPFLRPTRKANRTGQRQLTILDIISGNRTITGGEL
jgi:hypothetical protein